LPRSSWFNQEAREKFKKATNPTGMEGKLRKGREGKGDPRKAPLRRKIVKKDCVTCSTQRKRRMGLHTRRGEKLISRMQTASRRRGNRKVYNPGDPSWEEK